MLTRILTSAILLTLLATVIPANADPDNTGTPAPTVTSDPNKSLVEVGLTGVSATRPGSSGGEGGGGPECHYQGKPKPCKTGAGTWSNGMNCYYRPVDFYVEPAVLAQSEGTWR